MIPSIGPILDPFSHRTQVRRERRACGIGEEDLSTGPQDIQGGRRAQVKCLTCFRGSFNPGIIISYHQRGPKANAIKINAGIHTGNLMAGVIKEAIPRYSIIGQAFFKAKQVQKRASGE